MDRARTMVELFEARPAVQTTAAMRPIEAVPHQTMAAAEVATA